MTGSGTPCKGAELRRLLSTHQWGCQKIGKPAPSSTRLSAWNSRDSPVLSPSRFGKDQGRKFYTAFLSLGDLTYAALNTAAHPNPPPTKSNAFRLIFRSQRQDGHRGRMKLSKQRQNPHFPVVFSRPFILYIYICQYSI